MPSSGMLRRVALVRTNVSEELSASFIRVTRIGELGATLPVSSNRRTLRRNIKSVLTRATRRNIPEDTILHSHRRENLKSFMDVFSSTLTVFHHLRVACVLPPASRRFSVTLLGVACVLPPVPRRFRTTNTTPHRRLSSVRDRRRLSQRHSSVPLCGSVYSNFDELQTCRYIN
jgi:hypothetical protein